MRVSVRAGTRGCVCVHVCVCVCVCVCVLACLCVYACLGGGGGRLCLSAGMCSTVRMADDAATICGPRARSRLFCSSFALEKHQCPLASTLLTSRRPHQQPKSRGLVWCQSAWQHQSGFAPRLRSGCTHFRPKYQRKGANSDKMLHNCSTPPLG